MRTARRCAPLALTFALALPASAVAQVPAPGQGRAGQAPPPPQNLQVLPRDISRQDLQATMREFTFALGVMCDHCHVTEPARDFAADTKSAKKTARVMLAMTARINATIGDAVGKPAGDIAAVHCATCHRGKVIPETPVAPPPAPTAVATPR